MSAVKIADFWLTDSRKSHIIDAHMSGLKGKSSFITKDFNVVKSLIQETIQSGNLRPGGKKYPGSYLYEKSFSKVIGKSSFGTPETLMRVYVNPKTKQITTAHTAVSPRPAIELQNNGKLSLPQKAKTSTPSMKSIKINGTIMLFGKVLGIINIVDEVNRYYIQDEQPVWFNGMYIDGGA